MKKIMIINIGHHFGGAEKYIYEFLRNNNFKNKYYVFVRESNRLHEYLTNIDNVEIFSVKEKWSFLSMIYNLLKFSRNEGIDIFHAHTTASNLVGTIVSTLLRKTIITTIHGIVNFDYPNPLKRKTYLWLEKVLLLKNKKYICVSNYVKGYLENQGYQSNKLTVVYNGVNVNNIDLLEVKKLKTKYKIKDDTIVIGTVGRLEKVKNPSLVIKITAELINNNYDCRCIIVGEGSLQSELKKLASNLGVLNNIQFIGYSDNPHKYMGIMNVYIHSSTMETFGLTVVEAAILGKNVLCNEVGALREVSKFFNNINLVQSNNVEEYIKGIIGINRTKEVPELNENSTKLFSWNNNIEYIQKIYLNC